MVQSERKWQWHQCLQNRFNSPQHMKSMDIDSDSDDDDLEVKTDVNFKNYSIGQLKMIINDLLHRIQDNNRQLIELLIDRDSLSMEHDSLLVDFEDLRQRLEELSQMSSFHLVVHKTVII